MSGAPRLEHIRQAPAKLTIETWTEVCDWISCVREASRRQPDERAEKILAPHLPTLVKFAAESLEAIDPKRPGCTHPLIQNIQTQLSFLLVHGGVEGMRAYASGLFSAPEEKRPELLALAEEGFTHRTNFCTLAQLQELKQLAAHFVPSTDSFAKRIANSMLESINEMIAGNTFRPANKNLDI